MKSTKILKKLNIKENYMNEDIIEEFLEGLNMNISLTELVYDKNRDCVLQPEVIEKITKQLNINRQF